MHKFKILIDECLPKKLKLFFTGHEVWTVSELKIKGYKNGRLLKYANQNGFDIFVTIDSGIVYQQNLKEFDISIITLKCKTNKFDDLLELKNKILILLNNIENGKSYLIE